MLTLFQIDAFYQIRFVSFDDVFIWVCQYGIILDRVLGPDTRKPDLLSSLGQLAPTNNKDGQENEIAQVFYIIFHTKVIICNFLFSIV